MLARASTALPAYRNSRDNTEYVSGCLHVRLPMRISERNRHGNRHRLIFCGFPRIRQYRPSSRNDHYSDIDISRCGHYVDAPIRMTTSDLHGSRTSVHARNRTVRPPTSRSKRRRRANCRIWRSRENTSSACRPGAGCATVRSRHSRSRRTYGNRHRAGPPATDDTDGPCPAVSPHAAAAPRSNRTAWSDTPS